MHSLLSGLIMACFLLSGPVAAAPTAPGARSEPPTLSPAALEKRVMTRVNRLVKSEMEDCAKERPSLVALARTSGFDLIGEGARRGALLSILLCSDDYAEPDALFAATKLAPLAASPYEHAAVAFTLLVQNQEAERGLPAARRMMVILDGAPELVAHWEPQWFTPMLKAAKTDDRSLHLGLLSRLVNAPWTNPGSIEAARTWWRMDLARRQATTGNLIALRDTLKPVDDPVSLIAIAQDRRFEKLWPEMQAAGRFDWSAVAEADLARKRKALADEPRRLTNLIDVMNALRLLRRADEAVALGQAARARLAQKDSFEDQADQAAWLLMTLADCLADLARFDELDAVFAEAVVAGDTSGDRISQRINWAAHLTGRGETARTLALMDAIADEDGSDFGLALRDMHRVCAQSDIAPAQLESLLRKVKARTEANPAAAYQAYLCLNRLDEAAAVQLDRLKSEDFRHQALTAILRGAASPRPLTAFERLLLDRRLAVAARTDVAKALEAAGRPLQTPYGGDYWSPPELVTSGGGL